MNLVWNIMIIQGYLFQPEAEIAEAPRQVREAYATFLHPPRFELYDLEADPNEFKNLADDPQHAETKQRLVSVLEDWQVKMRDPFGDPNLLRDFAAHQEAMRDLRYRKEKAFRWPYLDLFPAWGAGDGSR